MAFAFKEILIMKILLAAYIFPPQSGGPATYVVALANALEKAGDNVTVVSLNPKSGKNHVACDMYHVTASSKVFKYLQYFWLLFKHSKSVDVIYAMGPVNAGLPTCIVSWLRRKKFVVKVVGDYSWEQYPGKIQDTNSKIQKFVSVDEFQDMKVGDKIGWLKMIERKVVRRADKVIVPSEYLKGIVEGWGAKSGNVEVVYNAVGFKSVEPMKKIAGEQWLVSVARLLPWKGMDTLIKIMPKLLKTYPNLKLKIVGDGEIISDFRFQISELALEDSVELTGTLPHDQALSYIAAADVFVLNSGYEGLSHVILEALHCGIPVLASDAGGNAEVVERENLFEYNNGAEIQRKVSKILQQPNTNDKKDFKQFGFTAMFQHTKNVLQDV